MANRIEWSSGTPLDGYSIQSETGGKGNKKIITGPERVNQLRGE